MAFIYSQLFVTPKYPTHDFSEQTAIVTGSNIGLGREAARHLVRLNAAKVILAVRNLEAGEEARRSILDSNPSRPTTTVEVWKLDLSSYESVKQFAARASSELPRIDVLLENAAIAATSWNVSEGHERTITVNVISTFLLALLMLPKLKKDAKTYNISPRVTIVSSEVHGRTPLPERQAENTFAALDERGPESLDQRYPTSKLLEVLVVRHLAPKLKGTGVILNMLNPGLCHSALARDAGWQLWIMKAILARSTEVGSRTLVAAAAAGEESHGSYMNDGVVDDSVLSPFAQSDEGRETGVKVWNELKQILEAVQSGSTGDL